MLPGLDDAGLEVGLVGGEDGGHLLDVLGGLLLDDVDGVVNGDYAHQPLLRIHHRQRQEVVFAKSSCGLLLVRMGAYILYVGLHYIADNFVFSCQQQVLHGDNPQKLPSAVRNIAGVDGLLLHPRAAYALEGLFHGHAPFQVHILHGHDAPGAVLGVVEHLVYHPSGLAVHVAEYLLHDIGGHLLDHVHRVVQKQLLHHLVQLPVAEAPHQQLLALGLHIGEGVRRQLLWQQPE